MTQMMVCNCGSAFEEEDMFCGNCGNPRALTATPAVPPPTVRPEPPPTVSQPVVPPEDTPGGQARREARLRGGGFFSQATAQQPGPMSNATRYLCAAAYLSPLFANTVIGELVESHRAVVPSRGIDLIPIIRHCLKARKMQLVRDFLLSILLLLGVILATGPLIVILLIMFLLGFLPGTRWERRSLGGRMIAGVAAVGAAAVLVVVGGVIAAFFLYLYLASRISGGVSGLLGPGIAIIWVVYACLVVATLVYYCYIRNRTLGEWLSPGAQAPPFDRASERVEERLGQIDRAQHGNLTLYSEENPFLGTGIPPFRWRRSDNRDKYHGQVWSISIELQREGAPRGVGPTPQGQVHIDPVELHAALRKRLLQLNDPALPPNERIWALSVDDHVVGEGRFRWDSPLVDPGRQIPYSQANPEAIAALIRNPQARLRYYQRVSISDEGQTVLAADQPVIGSVDQEVVVSAFVYVAVEGHMFYLQFVPAALAPIADYFHMIDQLPKISSGKFTAKVVLDAARTSFRDFLGAPYGMYRTLRLMRGERKSFREGLQNSRDFVYADIGANISVRELGARQSPRTYIQQLDVTKYTQIVERLVIETVLDFLVAKGADTSAYRASAQAIYSNSVFVSGSNSGNINTGSGNIRQGDH
jgi:hypothetical protein